MQEITSILAERFCLARKHDIMQPYVYVVSIFHGRLIISDASLMHEPDEPIGVCIWSLYGWPICTTYRYM